MKCVFVWFLLAGVLLCVVGAGTHLGARNNQCSTGRSRCTDCFICVVRRSSHFLGIVNSHNSITLTLISKLISFHQSSLLYPATARTSFVAAHMLTILETQTNWSGRSILAGYCLCNRVLGTPSTGEEYPKNRTTTTIKHTYKALRLVKEQSLEDIIYVIDSDSPPHKHDTSTDRTDAVNCCISTTFAHSFYCSRLECLCGWCRDRSGQFDSSQRFPCRTVFPFCAHFHHPQVAFRCVVCFWRLYPRWSRSQRTYHTLCLPTASSTGLITANCFWWHLL